MNYETEKINCNITYYGNGIYTCTNCSTKPVESSNRNNYLPVTDDNHHLLGEIDLSKIRNVIFRTELYYRFTVRQLMTLPPAKLSTSDSMERVMKVFDETGADYLPVINVEGYLEGYISRTRMYAMYRQVIRDYSTE